MSEQPVPLREPGGPSGGMLCPVCAVTLVMADRQGVEIDYCPKCRGVWLDRGEIDKIVERSLDAGGRRPASDRAAAAPAPGYPPSQGWSGRGHGGDHGGGGHGGGDHGGGGHGGGGHGDWGRSSHGHGGQRRRSWLSDMFD